MSRKNKQTNQHQVIPSPVLEPLRVRSFVNRFLNTAQDVPTRYARAQERKIANDPAKKLYLQRLKRKRFEHEARKAKFPDTAGDNLGRGTSSLLVEKRGVQHSVPTAVRDVLDGIRKLGANRDK